MSITKCRVFAKQMSQKLSFSFPQKAFRSYRICKVGDIEAAFGTETSELGQTESQFGGTETARVSQSPELGHTDLQFSVRLKITCVMA